MANVSVDPKREGSGHQVSLSDGTREWGIRLSEGARSVQEAPATPSNIRITGGGSKFGDFDPSFSHIEIRDWSGGRGLENHVDDNSRFFDSQMAWTFTPGRLHQGLQWQVSSGMRGEDRNLPGSVNWEPLFSDQRYVAVTFTASTTYQAHKMSFWVRRVGSPGALTVQHRSSASGRPSSVVNTSAATGTSAITDVISRFHGFAISSQSQSSGNDYWLVIYGSSLDTASNHWEIGVDAATSGGYTSSNASSANWSSAAWKPYFRVVDDDRDRKMHLFRVGSSQWRAVSQHDNGTSASQIYTLSTGTTQWSLLSTADFSSNSGTSALTGVVEDVAVQNNIAMLARGASTGTAYYRLSGSSHELRNSSAASSNFADRLYLFHDPVDGPQVWRALSTLSQAYRAGVVTWGNDHGSTAGSTWTPSTGIPIGDQSFNIMELHDYNDQIYIRKQDGLWTVKNDRAAKLNVGLESVTENEDFLPMMAKDLFLYFSWSHSLERLYGATLDDIGPWKNEGIPSSRKGNIVALDPGIGMFFAGVDAGTTGVSHVLAWNDRGWHEVFRAPDVGLRVQNVKWDPNPNGRPRLWISCGGELYYINFPQDTLNPLRDGGVTYQHESVVEQATIDLGVSQLPKLFDSLHGITEGLNSSGSEIHVEYQIDDEVGGSSWISVGRFLRSPSDQVGIRRGDKHRIRIRTRMLTATSTSATVVNAYVLKGVARTPVKRQWNIRARAGTFQVTAQGLPDHDPDNFYLWLQDAAATTKPLRMRSVWEVMNKIWVFAEPPIVQREYQTPDGQHGEQYSITLREI